MILLGFAVFLVIDEGKHAGATTALGAAALAVLILAVDLRDLLSRGSEFNFGFFSFKFGEDALEAREKLDKEGDAEGDESAPGPENVLSLRLRLEAKLAYLAKHQLVGSGPATFLTIGSLNQDGGLTPRQAEIATGVLTFRDDELARLPKRERDDFLEEATRLVKTFRATVHQNMTHRRLVKEEGWSTLSIREEGAPRDYFQVETGDGRTFRVAAVYAFDSESGSFKPAIGRLKASANRTPRAGARVVVVPDNSEIAASDGDPRVVHLSELVSSLRGKSHPTSARE